MEEGEGWGGLLCERQREALLLHSCSRFAGKYSEGVDGRVAFIKFEYSHRVKIFV